MAGSCSPCGACKFLRRKCVRGCVFAPYFSHEQGAAHFAAIHKVFGASNVSKLLSNLPVGCRCEAAVTISYEAQARVQDPIYGCVSHIFALQHQILSLQAQLASLKEHAAQGLSASTRATAGGGGGERFSMTQQLFELQTSQLNPNSSSLPPQFCLEEVSNLATNRYQGTFSMEYTGSMENYKNSSILSEDNTSFGSFEGVWYGNCDGQWSFQDACELSPMALDYARRW
ncbi:hypothetical protein SAY87_000499 [Trapa incisa]|uniref:LOB domain-containing protein n=1 Tax=Trapa incisa TaxID=236973 RepID=A0AAN7GEM3_9MYRT|nr:hypothetical protein SAY87_000499 [Trapa incisa]